MMKFLKFMYDMDNCYFPTSRDKDYPSVKSKIIAQNAMMFLWFVDAIIYDGKIYFCEDIRDIMIDDMMVEHLDYVVENYGGEDYIYLAAFLFHTIQIWDDYIQELFNRDFPNGCPLPKGGAA